MTTSISTCNAIDRQYPLSVLEAFAGDAGGIDAGRRRRPSSPTASGLLAPDDDDATVPAQVMNVAGRPRIRGAGSPRRRTILCGYRGRSYARVGLRVQSGIGAAGNGVVRGTARPESL